MKKNFLQGYICLILLFLAFIFSSCSSSSNEPDTLLPSTTGFTWRENDPNGALKTAGSSELRTQYKSIFAFTGATSSTGTLFEFNLTGVTPGTYPVNASNAFYFNGNSATPATGEVVITSNANGKASGTFKAIWSSGAITSVYGTFTDIPVN